MARKVRLDLIKVRKMLQDSNIDSRSGGFGRFKRRLNRGRRVGPINRGMNRGMKGAMRRRRA